MTTAIKYALSPFAQPKTDPDANAIRFLDERLASLPAADIPEGFRRLSHFIPVIVLVPKSAFEDEAIQKKLKRQLPLYHRKRTSFTGPAMSEKWR